MDENEERENLLNEIQKTNLIPSLKAQMKMAIKDKLKSKLVSPIQRSVSTESEVANNIILEFLFSCGFHSTASIFFAESSMHQLSREEIIDSLSVSESPGTVAELLVSVDSKPSISTQTDFKDLGAKLTDVDDELRRRRRDERALSNEEVLRRGMDDLENEFELKFNTELQNRLDVFYAKELSEALSSDREKQQMELGRIRKELEADLRKKTNEERTKFDRTADGLRAKQRELEVEISKWAEQNVMNAKESNISLEARQVLNDCEEKAQKIRAKTLVLSKKLESDICKLEDEQLEHRKAKREIEKLKMSIALLDQNSLSNL